MIDFAGHGFLCPSVQVCTFLLLWLCVSGGGGESVSMVQGQHSENPQMMLWVKIPAVLQGSAFSWHFWKNILKKWKRSNTTANNFQKSINLVISIRKACHWLLKNRNILLDWFLYQYCMNTAFKFYPWWSALQGNCCSKTGISYSTDFIIRTAWTQLLSFTLGGQCYRVTCSKTGISYLTDFIIRTAWTQL